MKIAVIGNYGATNVGDEAILTSILKKLEGHEVVVFSAQPEITKANFGTEVAPLFPFGFRSFFRHGFKRSTRVIKEAQVVILGGGGLFQDNSYFYACFLWAWQIGWVKWFKKPLFIHSVGVGPLKTRMGRWLTKWTFNKADVITVRDEQSVSLLKKIGVKKEIHLTSDPVFLHEQRDFPSHRNKNLFIVSLRPWLTHTQEIIRVFSSFLQELKAARQAEFIFVSMQQIKEHDLQMIEPLVSKLGGKVYVPKNFSDLLNVMQTAEYAIGMRYHFMIAALLTQTPLLPISYSPKTEELFEGSELQEYVSQAAELSEEKLKKDIKRLSASYNDVMIYEKSLMDGYLARAKVGSQLLEIS